jgi:hypothetical protein
MIHPLQFSPNGNAIVVTSKGELPKARQLQQTLVNNLRIETDVFTYTWMPDADPRGNQDMQQLILTGPLARWERERLKTNQITYGIASKTQQYGLNVNIDEAVLGRLQRHARFDPKINMDDLDRFEAYRKMATTFNIKA